ncbi:MAG: tripartite tricarboxylate transporter substrate binding protein [Pseudomonadota bacterium]
MNRDTTPHPLSRKRLLSLALGAALCGALAPAATHAAAADGYPSKPIRLLVPSPSGGGIDLLARMFAQRLSEQMGQSVVVDNIGGAGGTIAAGIVARSAPDGYTLIFQATNGAVNAAALPNLPFDAVNGFTPVTLAARFPLVMIVNKEVPATDARQLVALLKQNPGTYSYGSAGIGTGTHLAAEWFKTLAKVDMLHVPYKGTGAIMPDLLANRVQIMFDGLPPQAANIKTGRVRALAVTTTERSRILPEIPPLSEVLPGYDLPFWTGIFAPPHTPRDIVDKLAAETRKAVDSPELSQKLRDFGAKGVGSTPGEFSRFWAAQVGLYRKILTQGNIKLEGN